MKAERRPCSKPPIRVVAIAPPPDDAPLARIDAGKALFHPYCSNCHGDAAVSGGFIPDLRDSPALREARAWRRIVYDGELQSRGMVGFRAELSVDDVEAIRSYVIARAHEMEAELRSANRPSTH